MTFEGDLVLDEINSAWYLWWLAKINCSLYREMAGIITGCVVFINAVISDAWQYRRPRLTTLFDGKIDGRIEALLIIWWRVWHDVTSCCRYVAETRRLLPGVIMAVLMLHLMRWYLPEMPKIWPGIAVSSCNFCAQNVMQNVAAGAVWRVCENPVKNSRYHGGKLNICDRPRGGTSNAGQWRLA